MLFSVDFWWDFESVFLGSEGLFYDFLGVNEWFVCRLVDVYGIFEVGDESFVYWMYDV